MDLEKKGNILADVKNNLKSEYTKQEKKNVKSLSMGGFTILDWVERRGCPLTCLQNLLIIEWNKEILTRFLGNKKACCWKGARISIHSIS